MKTTLPKKILVLSLLISSFAFSIEYEQGYPVDDNQMIGAYNAPSRYDVEGSFDVFLSASFILWQPKQQGLNIALRSPKAPSSSSRVIQMNVDFDPGFKVAIGSAFPYDNWNLFAEYTHLYTTNKKKEAISILDSSLINYWEKERNLPFLNYISAKWRLFLDILDLSFGRSYYVGTKLTFFPFLGLEASWIEQRFHINSINNPGISPSFFVDHFRSKSWLLGPRVGINTNWLLGKGVRFFGNIASSIFYQHCKLTSSSYQKIEPLVITTALSKENAINSNLHCNLGFGWGSYFYQKKFHIDIAASYEMLIFWNQNMMRSLLEELSSNISSKPGNLTPHGFTLTAQADF